MQRRLSPDTNNTATIYTTSEPFEPTVIIKHIRSKSELGFGGVSNGGYHRLTVPPAGLLGGPRAA